VDGWLDGWMEGRTDRLTNSLIDGVDCWVDKWTIMVLHWWRQMQYATCKISYRSKAFISSSWCS